MTPRQRTTRVTVDQDGKAHKVADRLFNATKDSVENRWKALEPYEMLLAKKFTETVYYHELVRALIRFGHRGQNKPRGDFDIEGMSPEIIERFSKRHQEIDQRARKLLAREPEKASRNVNEIRANIAHKERARKIKDIGLTRLQSLWKHQLSLLERFRLGRLSTSLPKSSSVGTSSRYVPSSINTVAAAFLWLAFDLLRCHEFLGAVERSHRTVNLPG